MIIDIDRHILSSIIKIRKDKKALMTKKVRIKYKLKTELNAIDIELYELEGREDGLLLHLFGNVNGVDTGKGQETPLGKEVKDELEK